MISSERMKKESIEKLKRVTAVAAIGAAAFGGITGCAEVQGSAESGVETTTTPTPTLEDGESGGIVSDSESGDSQEQEPTTEQLRISAELPPEELAQAVQDLQAKWDAASTTDQELDAIQRKIDEDYNKTYVDTSDDTCKQVAQKNAEIFAPALFGDDWKFDKNRTEYVQNMIDTNISFIVHAFGQRAMNEPASTMSWQVSDVQQFTNGQDDDFNDLNRFYWSQETMDAFDAGQVKLLEFSSTSHFENWPDQTASTIHQGMALRVENDNTVSVIEVTTATK